MNDLGQRTSVTQSGTAFSNLGDTVATHSLVWGYDSRGQVISEDHSATARDNAYRYDAIGNRTHDVHGSLALPATANYAANPLNQYTATPAARGAAPTYDADGNTLSGPVPGANPVANGTAVQATNWIWDAENRLRGVTVDGQSHTYDYDYLGRRIAQDSTVYLYDGWNLLTVQDDVDTSPSWTFTWGQDLSGSLQGAGGVGGLLMVTHMGIDCSPLYDGNGNATQYLDADGYRARWEYDAFGRTTWQSDDEWSDVIYHRFSTKYQDIESTGLYYYGYRYYDPQTGRWPSRDPIEEDGGTNLYGFVGNDGLNRVDILGLKKIDLGATKGRYGTSAAYVTIEGGYEISGELDTETCCVSVTVAGDLIAGLGFLRTKSGKKRVLGVGVSYSGRLEATIARSKLIDFDNTFTYCPEGGSGSLRLNVFDRRIGATLEASATGGISYGVGAVDLKAVAKGSAYLEARLDIRVDYDDTSASAWLEGEAGYSLDGSVDIGATLSSKVGKWKKPIKEWSLWKDDLGGYSDSTGILKLSPTVSF